MVNIKKYNESFIYIDCDLDIAINISEHFEFYKENYFYSPKYKSGLWDGKIRLFNKKTGLLPIGLCSRLVKVLEHYDYNFIIDNELIEKGKKISSKNLLNFSGNLLKTPFQPRDYQIKAVQLILYLKKCIILSATASGKSFIAFLIFNLLKYLNDDFKFLLIVPTTVLVEQMSSDFKKYGQNFCDYDDYVHKIYSGKDKNTEKIITVSTWQSLQNLPKKYFEKFDCIIVDECHTAKAVVLSSIINNCVNAQYKIGMSGSLKNSKIDKLQLEAMFSKIHRVSKTNELIKRGFLSKLKINSIILNHPKKIRKFTKGFDYNTELNFVNENESKIKYVCKLTASRKNNTLVLFRHIKYGKTLLNRLSKLKDKKLFYVDGDISVKYRNNIRPYCEKNNDAIIIASYETFSTGISINNLTNIIFAESMKSFIKIIQSIGRGLRKHKNKIYMNLFDIGDNLSNGKSKNYMMKHFFNRIEYYEDEDFNYIVKEINLK